MKRLVPIALLVAAVALGWSHFGQLIDLPNLAGHSDQALARAFDDRQTGVQSEGEGVVVRVLSDDNDGSRHQRFIVRLASGQTLLIAHNIDLAPRIPALTEGDVVQFNGEYEWNSKGGVIHWTHRDPQGRHVAGWLKHNGRTYQ